MIDGDDRVGVVRLAVALGEVGRLDDDVAGGRAGRASAGIVTDTVMSGPSLFCERASASE